MHPDDATALGAVDGSPARVTSAVGELLVPIEITEAVMPGVVSLPHAWGHGAPGARLDVARDHPGVNSNLLTDGSVLDPLSGNAQLNAIPVRVEAAPGL